MGRKWVEESAWTGTWRGQRVDLLRIDKAATAIAMLGTTSPELIGATDAERAAGALIAAYTELVGRDLDEAWSELESLIRALRGYQNALRAKGVLKGAF